MTDDGPAFIPMSVSLTARSIGGMTPLTVAVIGRPEPGAFASFDVGVKGAWRAICQAVIDELDADAARESARTREETP